MRISIFKKICVFYAVVILTSTKKEFKLQTWLMIVLLCESIPGVIYVSKILFIILIQAIRKIWDINRNLCYNSTLWNDMRLHWNIFFQIFFLLWTLEVSPIFKNNFLFKWAEWFNSCTFFALERLCVLSKIQTTHNRKKKAEIYCRKEEKEG